MSALETILDRCSTEVPYTNSQRNAQQIADEEMEDFKNRVRFKVRYKYYGRVIVMV